jgi:hypothetical protein
MPTIGYSPWMTPALPATPTPATADPFGPGTPMPSDRLGQLQWAMQNNAQVRELAYNLTHLTGPRYQQQQLLQVPGLGLGVSFAAALNASTRQRHKALGQGRRSTLLGSITPATTAPPTLLGS